VAKEPKQAHAHHIEFDPLAEKLAADPATIPDSVALTGFVGRSAEDGNVRLYVDASFRNYYEISISDVLHNQQLPTTQSPLGGSVVYVKGGAPLRRVQISTEIEARFLHGPMSNTGTVAGGKSSLPLANRAFLYRAPFTIICRHSDAPTSCEDVCVRVTVDCFTFVNCGDTIDC